MRSILGQIWRLPKLLNNIFYEHFRDFGDWDICDFKIDLIMSEPPYVL